MSICNEASLPVTPELDWEIDAIVSQLRALRDASLVARHRESNPAKLPSRTALAGIADGLIAAMFPNRLGARVLVNESVDFFVGHTIDVALRELVDQLARELRFAAGDDAENKLQRDRAGVIVSQFAGQLPHIRAALETDIRAVYEADPAARNVDEVLACYPGIVAIAYYRLAHSLYVLGAPLVGRMISEIAHSLTGIEIHPAAEVGESFSIDHGTGVVIGASARIGARVRIYHAVTVGAKRLASDSGSRSERIEQWFTTIEDDVVIHAGAMIVGEITIGRGSVIGGNVWITRSVPQDSFVSQAQVRSEVFGSGEGI